MYIMIRLTLSLILALYTLFHISRSVIDEDIRGYPFHRTLRMR
jgi:hypothetical protein